MTGLESKMLEHRWCDLCRRLAPDAGTTIIQAQFSTIVAAYAARPREYHNLDHIAACLHELDAHRTDAEDPDRLEFAIWLHDCVYEPTRGDNEQRSAEVARSVAGQLGLSAVWIEACCNLMLATRHIDLPRTADERLIVDVDLSILAAPPEQYDRYRRAIRAEYKFADDAAFRAGRGSFLTAMLARPSIFQTRAYQDSAEASARVNLLRELADIA